MEKKRKNDKDNKMNVYIKIKKIWKKKKMIKVMK